MVTINLPDLQDYRREFARQGVISPLPIVPSSNSGLLSELPSPPSNKTGWPWTIETQPPEEPKLDRLLWPKISIVTPSFNQGQFIEETVRSVLLQNYPNLEYIICDGGSTDATVTILEKYSPWLSYYQSKKDRGQGHAINLGFSLCSGDYFGWVNSDDFYLPKALQSLALDSHRHPSDFIYGDALILDDNKRKYNYWHGYLVRDRYLYLGGLIPSHAAFWRSSIHVPICEDLHCAMDYELWLRLLPGRSRRHLRLPLGVFRDQAESKSANERFRILWQEDEERIIKKYGALVSRRSLRHYELRLVQRAYRHFVGPLLASGSWSDMNLIP